MTIPKMGTADDLIAIAVTTELASAREKFAPFHSEHEGYAIIREEFEELVEEAEAAEAMLVNLWREVRGNDRAIARDAAEVLADIGERAAKEAVQLAAMARRFLADLPVGGAELVNYWVSWFSAGPFEYHGPWWISGEEGGGAERATVVAAVCALSADAARATITAAHDVPLPEIEWRFVESRPSDWSPFTDRFPRADWMAWPS